MVNEYRDEFAFSHEFEIKKDVKITAQNNHYFVL